VNALPLGKLLATEKKKKIRLSTYKTIVQNMPYDCQFLDQRLWNLRCALDFEFEGDATSQRTTALNLDKQTTNV